MHQLYKLITQGRNACTQSFLLNLWSKFYAKFISQTLDYYDEMVPFEREIIALRNWQSKNITFEEKVRVPFRKGWLVNSMRTNVPSYHMFVLLDFCICCLFLAFFVWIFCTYSFKSESVRILIPCLLGLKMAQSKETLCLIQDWHGSSSSWPRWRHSLQILSI